MIISEQQVRSRAPRIRLLLCDVDGVLTDGGVYYGADGEVMKRFSIRDGMGVERLAAVGVEVGLITGEESASVVRRAEKLNIARVHLLSKDKPRIVREIIESTGIAAEEIAYMGDDVNDLEAMKMVGLAVCPSDALPQIRDIAHYICRHPGGHGAFRELAELLIEGRSKQDDEQEIGFR